MSIRSLISKATAKKTTKSNKRGAMLIMTLLVLMFALIFCMSAIMLTSWTRERHYDATITDQARITLMSYAETIYQAIYLQEITDEQLWTMAEANAVVDFSDVPIPGGTNGSVPSRTTAKFSCQTQGNTRWVYVDITTTINDTTETLRMHLKAPAPVTRPDMFNNTVELADGGNLGQMTLGANAGGNTDNNIVLHGDANIADQGGTDIYSNVITTGVITGGSGNRYHGDLVFYGPDAGYNYQSAHGDGIRSQGNIYFVNPDAGSEYWALAEESFRMGYAIFDNNGNAATSSSPANNHNVYADFVYFQNTILNAYSNEGLQTYVQNVGNIYTGGTRAPVPEFDGQDARGPSGPYYTVNQNSSDTYSLIQTGNAELTAAAEGIDSYLTHDMFEAVTREVPDSEEARGMFGVPAGVPADAVQVGSFTTGEWEPGNYVVGNATMGQYNTSNYPVITIDLAKGSVTLYVTGNLTISNGYFNVINGIGSPNRFTIILSDNATLNIGDNCGYSAGDRFIGIVSSVHTNPNASSAADVNYIPHAYIFGANGNTVTISQNRTCDAYIGLYGDVAEVIFNNQPYFHGRIEASTIRYGHGSAVRIDYCMGPDAEEGTGEPIPVYSDFQVDRFQFFYSPVAE